jgi:hypothetical protein
MIFQASGGVSPLSVRKNRGLTPTAPNIFFQLQRPVSTSVESPGGSAREVYYDC